MGRDNGPKNERPAHEVRMSNAFQIARYEVPQSLWKAVMGDDPSKWKGRRNSVEMVSYADAQTFCNKATELLREAKLIEENEEIRLPSEAEWEYTARAGTTSLYSFGDTADQLGDFGWFTGNAAGNDPPVGAKRPNPWGLYDVHGYLWEWCSDDAHDDYMGAPGDGTSWSADKESNQGVLRGGSWKDSADQLTCSVRRFVPKELKDDAVGFRCVLARATQ
jgi:formylglycine-generating enzyme required for sulfatase activity